ncbi:MAG: YggT family protein [Eubacteriales bacterium]
MHVLQGFFYVICQAFTVFLYVLWLAMTARAVLSWFPIDEDSRLMMLLNFLTEPVVMPVRALLAMLHIGEDSPIDIGFIVTFLLIMVLSTILPGVTF